MQSNGGVVSPEIAIDHAAVTLLSGPAVARGRHHLHRDSRIQRLHHCDMEEPALMQPDQNQHPW